MDKAFEELDLNIKTLIDRLGKVEKDSDEYKQGIKELQAKAGRLKTAAASTSSLAGSIEAAFLENKDAIKGVASKGQASTKFEVKATPIDMTVLPSGAGATVSQIYPVIQFPPNRPYHIREVMAQHMVDTANVAYLKETSIDGNVSPTKMGSVKPQLTMNLQEATSKVQTIAGWVRIATQLLDDIGYLLPYLTFRLSENLLVAEDNQILNGDGNDPNLSGILLAANHTAKTGSATIFLEKLVQAAGQLAGYNRRASAIIVNSADFYAMMLNTASTSGLYSWPSVMQVSPDGTITILGVKVIWSAAISAGNYLVGDFTFGGALWFRQLPTVQIFYQDQDNVVSNKVTIRIEERVALTVFNAQAFIYPT